jgi:hypothetical protein
VTVQYRNHAVLAAKTGVEEWGEVERVVEISSVPARLWHL